MAGHAELERYSDLLTAALRELSPRVKAQTAADEVAIRFAAMLSPDDRADAAVRRILPTVVGRDPGAAVGSAHATSANVAVGSIGLLRQVLLPNYAARVCGSGGTTLSTRIPGTIEAGNGMAWACAAWNELATGPERHDALDTLITHQSPAGHFLRPSPADNLESWWYAELILLHAVGTYAVVANNEKARHAASRGASYHLLETQPDHATNEPWAIFSFLIQPATRSLADQLLHNARMMTPTGTALMLLADALYCLRTHLNREGSRS